MKSVSIITILCGTGIIISPFVHNLMKLRIVASLMQQGNTHAYLTGELTSSYSNWCMFVGVGVIACGLIIAVRSEASARKLV